MGSIKEDEEKSIRSLLAGEQVQSLFPSLTARKQAFLQRFCRCVREAEESSEGISAASIENTRSFFAVELHEPVEWQFQALISLDFPSCRRKARLLLNPCAGTEITQPPSRPRRLNLDSEGARAAAMVPSVSKKSMAVYKDWRMQL